MTLYNRPQLMLLNTLTKLGNNDWTDGEIVVVDDGSTAPYEPMFKAFQGLPLRYERVDTLKDRPGTYSLDGYNNPAYASNCALEISRGDFIFWMSSDIMVSPSIIHRAFQLDLERVAWMPCVVNMDDNATYLGPDRIAPFGWFYGVHRSHLEAVKWDEEYLKGIAFEDNDTMARLALRVGRFVIDKSCVVWHQSHEQRAYSDDLVGWKINEKYTKEKWGGSVPWQDNCPLTKKMTSINHQMILDVSMDGS